MVAVYVRCIEQDGSITNINRVIKKYREEVRRIIEADGYIVEEDGTIRKAD